MTQTMVGSMLLFGGEVLHNFALALTIGILFGIYSSVLVACPIAMWLGVSRANLIGDIEKKDKKFGLPFKAKALAVRENCLNGFLEERVLPQPLLITQSLSLL